MNNRNAKKEKIHQFPLEQLQKISRHDPSNSKRINTKKIVASKAIMKNHSKSLYYYSSQNKNTKGTIASVLNSTGANLISQNEMQQTLNAQLLGMERPKPQTSDCKSGRLAYLQSRNANLRSNKISLRTSSQYQKLASVAGVPLNENQAQHRLESYLNTKNNARRTKQKQIQTENKKIAQRLNSQQSQYSTKKFIKEYESQYKISKRLTDSKVSRRQSHSIDNRSIYSQNSSRASVRSGSSRNSNTSSMKSTSRVNSSNSSARKQGGNRFLAKLQPTKKIKIVEHNINKMNQDDLSKFKSLFANSFTTKNQATIPVQNTNQMYQKKILNNNPYVDMEILSQKSETSIKDSRSKTPQKQPHLYSSINNSNRKLKELNLDVHSNTANITKNNERLLKKSSAITSDGMLHRIVEEMYTNKDTKGSTENLIQRGISKNNHNVNNMKTNSTTKTTNPEVKTEKIMLNSGNKVINGRKIALTREEFNLGSILGGNRIFSTKF